MDELDVIQFATVEEMRENWDKLTDEEKRRCAEIEEYRREYKRHELHSPDQLPDIEGGSFVVIWDCDKEEKWTLLKIDDRVIWTEPALWEGYERFIQVAQILSQKYGARLKDVVPTDASHVLLYGDILADYPYNQVKYCRQQLRGRDEDAERKANFHGLVEKCKNDPLLNRQAFQELLVALNDSDYRVRQAAAEALGEVGPEAMGAGEILIEMAKKDKEGLVRMAAADALRKIDRKEK